MNLAGTRAWGRLLMWLEQETKADAFARLKRAPLASDVDLLKVVLSMMIGERDARTEAA